MYIEAGRPSQHLVDLHTLKCGQEAREFDGLTTQRKYLCRASILPELWTVVVCQTSHAVDSICRATRQGWSPRHPWLNSVFPQSAEHRGYCHSNTLVSSVWGLLLRAGIWICLCPDVIAAGVGWRVGKRWEGWLESLTAMLKADSHVFVAK